ncbi:MAG: helix-turn-helix transcriptional regulator [Eubacteriales bacterium]|nr:helix-turn-helix transcriptional regulator [Eubacteriales bacterium]
MYQINSEQFGRFLNEIRKEKNLTQKQLAEKLFVSDKTVSKWERGASMPNISLLIPIADVLGITVTELLKGERIDVKKELNTKEVENIVIGSLDSFVRYMIRQHKKDWITAYLLCLFIIIIEIIGLTMAGLSQSQMRESILPACGLAVIFGGWFCFFAKEILPVHYDSNKINYYSQGIFRFHLAGLSLNNSNWTYICSVCKVGMMLISVLYPLICYGSIIAGGIILWEDLKDIILIIMVILLVGAIYIIGRKYE